MSAKSDDPEKILEAKRRIFLLFLIKAGKKIIRTFFTSRKDYEEKMRDTGSEMYPIYKTCQKLIFYNRREAMKLGISMSELEHHLWS